MGEAAQEESKAAEAQPEEKKEEKPEDQANEEEKKGDGEKHEENEADMKPPSPAILSVDINCAGCAKKVKRTILKSRGVEDVQVDRAGKQVTVKGMIDPQALCTRVETKTKKKASVISPTMATKDEAEMVNAQASGEMNTVMLNVNMHCERCALQLQKRILRMRGVQTAETDFATGKVTVTGTMDANKLVEYVYKRTRKHANIIPPPSPPPPPPIEGEKKPSEEPEPEEKKEEDKHEEGKEAEEKKEEGKEEEKTEEGKEEEKKEEGGGEEEKKGEEDDTKKEEEEGKDNQEENRGGVAEEGKQMDQDDTAKKMVYYPSIYVIERVYAPQLFSDENPNACCIL